MGKARQMVRLCVSHGQFRDNSQTPTSPPPVVRRAVTVRWRRCEIIMGFGSCISRKAAGLCAAIAWVGRHGAVIPFSPHLAGWLSQSIRGHLLPTVGEGGAKRRMRGVGSRHMTQHRASPRIKRFARSMRSEGLRRKRTRSGRLLRDCRFLEYRFRRQVPIGPFIADFVCYGRRLIVELDGNQHAVIQPMPRGMPN